MQIRKLDVHSYISLFGSRRKTKWMCAGGSDDDDDDADDV